MKKYKTLTLILMSLMALSPMSVFAEEETPSQTESETTAPSETTTETTVSPVFQEDIVSVVEGEGYELPDYYRPEGAIVVDSQTGEIIYGSQVDKQWDPASVSKVMTAYLAFEAMKEGKFSLDTIVTASENDRAISAIGNISNNIIVAGAEYPVHELLKFMMYPSSNVATVMMAHLIDETDGAFVDRMNAKAKEWGMVNTQFNNASGAAAINYRGLYEPVGYDLEANNQTTARDLAILAYHFMKDFPEFIEFTKNPYVTIMEGTPYEESFYTLNYSMPGMPYGYPGVDGFKTGSSESGALSYLVTAKQEETRYLLVVLGVGSWYDFRSSSYYRSQIGNALLNKAFTEYETKTVLTAGEHTMNGVKFQLDQDVTTLVRKGEEASLTLDGDHLTIHTDLPRLTDNLAPLTIPITIIPEEKPEEVAVLGNADKQFVVPEGTTGLARFALELGNQPFLLGSVIIGLAVVISGVIVGSVILIKRLRS